MIGFDTNILVRFLTGDDPVQSPIALRMISERRADDPGFISLVALVETASVLKRAYHCTDTEVAGGIEQLLRLAFVHVERALIAYQAVFNLRQGVAAFAEAIMARNAAEVGCAYTLTFDRKAARLPEFHIPM